MAEKDKLSDSELLTKLNNMFRFALDHPAWLEGRRDMVRTFEYKEGKQWTDEERAILRARHQPDTVNNQVAITVNKLMGDLVEQRYRIGFKGRNSPVDDAVASMLSDIFLYIRQTNRLEFEETEMGDDGFTSGFGVMRVSVTFDDMFQPEITVKQQDCLTVFPDPSSRRYDWNEDAKFICCAQWVSLDEVLEKYPKKKADLKGIADSTSEGDMGGQLADVEKLLGRDYVDKDSKQVRLIEIEYKKYEREEIVLFSNGVSLPAENVTDEMRKQADEAKIDYEVIDRVRPIICRGVFAAGVLLEHKETKRKYFSFIPYFVFRRKNGAPYSYITLALPMQDAINKRESKALHLLNSNQVIAERNALGGDKEAVAEELAKPDGIVDTLSEGSLTNGKVQFRNNLELATTQFNLHKSAQEDFRQITGVDPRAFAQTGEIRSGSGLKQKFAEASKPVASLFTNMRRSRGIAGMVILDFVQNYFTKEKAFLVTDDDKRSRLVNLTMPLLEKIKTAQYDVTVDDLEDNINVQQEQRALLMQYLPQIIPLGPAWTRVMLELSDLKEKEKLLEMMAQMSQPQPTEPKVSVTASLDQLTPEERAFFYEKMGNPQLAEAIRQIAPMTRTETEKALVLANTKVQEDNATARDVNKQGVTQ